MGTQYFLSTPRSWQDEKKGFFFLGKTSWSQVVPKAYHGLLSGFLEEQFEHVRRSCCFQARNLNRLVIHLSQFSNKPETQLIFKLLNNFPFFSASLDGISCKDLLNSENCESKSCLHLAVDGGHVKVNRKCY